MKHSLSPFKYVTETRVEYDRDTGKKIEDVQHWIYDSRGKFIASVATYDRPAEANGRLFAAAPDMKAVLEIIKDKIDMHARGDWKSDAMGWIEEVLAKANGTDMQELREVANG